MFVYVYNGVQHKR